MQRKHLFSMLTAGVLSWTTIVAAQQTPTVPTAEARPAGDSAIIVRPSQDLLERLQKSKSRDGLIKNLERMAKQRTVDAAMQEEFRKRSEGTAHDVAIDNLLGTTLLADTAEGLGPAIVLAEDYQYELAGEAERTAHALVRRVKDIRVKDDQIRQLAERIVGGKDADGKPLSEVQLQAMEKLIFDWKKHRLQMESHRDQYRNDLIFCQGELTEIAALDQFFEGESRILESRVERYLDAVEHGQRTIASKELKQSRDALLNAVSVLKGALEGPPDPPVPHPGQNPTGPGIANSRGRLGEAQALTADEKQFIQPELEAARQRLKGESPEPKK